MTSIGDFAFQNCNRLSEINAPNLRSIGKSAFQSCYDLQEFKIENNQSVLIIGDNAFASCFSLSKINIDQFIDYSENSSIFSGCNNIESLRLKNYNYSFDFDNEHFADSNNKTISELFGLDYTSGSSLSLSELIIDYCGIIPDNFCIDLPLLSVTIKNLEVSEVGVSAFANCTMLKKFDVPAAIIRVGDFAFFNTAITEFDGGSLQYIGDNAFSECKKLSEFNLEDNDEISYVGFGAFHGCRELNSFFLPQTISTISDCAFESCSGLTDLILGGEIVSIGENAFSGCSVLREMPQSEAIMSIGAFAFSNCVSLESLNLPQGLKLIGDYAFSGCNQVKSFTIPQSVSSIGLGAFLNCTSLEEISLPFIGGSLSENKFFSYIFGSDTPFFSNNIPQSLEKVTIATADEIGAQAFSG